MAKTKKRRKQYRGSGAAITPPLIRVEATQRGRFGTWWADHKSELIIRSVQIGFVLLLILFLSFVWSLLT